jgi:hypothetical protein
VFSFFGQKDVLISMEIESRQINENHSKYWKNVLEGERIRSAIDNKYKTESWKCESLMKINVRVILTVVMLRLF